MKKKNSNQYDEMNEQQMKFAEFYLDFNNGTTAAIKAGYAQGGAHVTASRLLKNVKVRDYINELRQRRTEAINNKLAAYAADIVSNLYDLALNAESEAVRLQATKDIMDRSGFKPVEKRENNNTLDGKIEFGFVDPTKQD